MSSFLNINGVEVPCDYSSGVRRNTDQLGESKRAVDGTMRVHRRVLKNRWDFRTTILDPLQGDCFRRLLLGEGHYWSFDDATKGLYSSKGLGPSASSGASISAANPWHGAPHRHLRLAATTGTITFTALPLKSGGHWTVMVARMVAGGSYEHFIVTSTGTPTHAWKDGIYGANAHAWLTVTPAAGTVKLDADAADITDYDELIILPWRIPQDSEAAEAPWGQQLFTFQDPVAGNALQWAPLARLRASGDALYPDHQASGYVDVAGKVAETGFELARWDSAWGLKPNLKHVAFTLEEI